MAARSELTNMILIKLILSVAMMGNTILTIEQVFKYLLYGFDGPSRGSGIKFGHAHAMR